MRNKKIIDDNIFFYGDSTEGNSHNIDENGTRSNSQDIDSSIGNSRDIDNDSTVGDSQDIDDDGTKSVDVYPADKPADNAITQQDAINLTCCNCRRTQCEELIANYGECYRIIFYR